MSGMRDTVDLELIVVRFTAKAVLVKETEFDDGVWLPLSRVEVDRTASGVAWVRMPERLAIEKGLL